MYIWTPIRNKEPNRRKWEIPTVLLTQLQRDMYSVFLCFLAKQYANVIIPAYKTS
jgi:hypothetical protein